MARIRILLTCLAAGLVLAAFPQASDSSKVRLNHYSFTLGTGWTHYIDNLENGNGDITKDFIGVSLKFFWEPEYRLSLGLETGYYKLFRTTHQFGDTVAHADRNVVPLLLLVRMRIIDNFHLGAGMGLAFVQNKLSGVGDEVVTKTNSLANFQLSASYMYPLGKMFRVGGEAKAFHFAAMDDWMYSLQALVAVRF